jgi:hypothetical protein
VLILKTVDKDRKAYGGFQWPESGSVECDTWDPTPVCGNGLHGLPHGIGDGSSLSWADECLWVVFEAIDSEVVVFNGKCKAPRGTVLFCGSKDQAVAYLVEHDVIAQSGPCVAKQATARDDGTAIAGFRGTAIAGFRGTATAGCRGTATAGCRGTAIAGFRGTATAGDDGTATAGFYGTAIAGFRGTATAGDRGTLVISWWDGSRRRSAVGCVGEDGIEPDTAYKVEAGNLVKAQ